MRAYLITGSLTKSTIKFVKFAICAIFISPKNIKLLDYLTQTIASAYKHITEHQLNKLQYIL